MIRKKCSVRWWPGAVMGAPLLLSPAAVAQNGAGEARLNADLNDSVWDATVSTKNRDRFLEAEVAKEFLARVGVLQLSLSNRLRRARRADICTSPIAQQNFIGRM